MRLLIVEDEPGIRESLVDFFEPRSETLSAAADLAQARRALADREFDVILLDLLLPDGDGVDFLKRLRGDGVDCAVLVATARGEEEQRILGLQAGADDYVVKPYSLRELEARIEAVLRRKGPAAPRILRLGAAVIDLGAYSVTRDGVTRKLLQKEADLLAFLVRNPGQTFRRSELLGEVWGYDSAPTTRTVDTHIFKLRKKIEVHPEEPRHFVTVHGVGYRFDPEVSPKS